MQLNTKDRILFVAERFVLDLGEVTFLALEGGWLTYRLRGDQQPCQVRISEEAWTALMAAIKEV